MNRRLIDANELADTLLNRLTIGKTTDGMRVIRNTIEAREMNTILNDAPTYSLNTLRDEIYADAVAHGLWEETEQLAEETGEDDVGKTLIATVEAVKKVFEESDELLTAAEAYNLEEGEEELADVVIQAFSTAGYLKIDIDAAIRRKMEINKKRPWKHGKE